MKALVITERALIDLASSQIDPAWFLKPTAVEERPNIEAKETDSTISVFTKFCSGTDRLLVIRLTPDGLFGGVNPAERRPVFDRCARLALRAFTYAITINARWMPFHDGKRVSIFANSIGHDERLVGENGPLNSSDFYIYEFGSSSALRDLKSCNPDYQLYERASSEIRSLLDQRPTTNAPSIVGQFDLAQVEINPITKGFSFSDWYPAHLTREQERFVSHSLVGPIRLRGAAGTGKTLAMALKALKTKYDASSRDKEIRILFVTHSWATAEFVDQLLDRLDIDKNGRGSITVFPLLFLANNRDYRAIGREPLGVDSEEGKHLALKEIAAVIDEFKTGDWVTLRSGCSENFSSHLEAPEGSKQSRLFCWDLLVEFGCVIAAQGLQTHPTDRERYLRLKRMKWMMPLSTESERDAAFALWIGFMNHLRDKKWIASDQIVSDYLNDLSTYYWDAARLEKGYDVIFVDEMHLFNSQERLVFHNLLSDANNPPVVVMALDPKQSPRETFTSVAQEGELQTKNIYERARLPNPEKMDLLKVFRYTPEIANLIKSVNEAAPALDLPEEWDMPESNTTKPSAGFIPSYKVVANKQEVFKEAMSLALNLSKDSRKRDGRAAVLCMDPQRFEEYSKAAIGQLQNDVMLVASRDDTEKLRYAGKRFLLSAPEYVAGLQFDTVIVVDVNADEVPEGNYSAYKLRRFLSELYLALSRAENKLVIIASKDMGGLPKLFDPAIASGQLVPHPADAGFS
jgi:hypothetical protein